MSPPRARIPAAAHLDVFIVPGHTGPRLDADGWLEPVAWLANIWVDAGDLPSLVDAVARGHRAARSHAVVRRPAEPFAEERARWRKETGTDEGDDVMAISVEFIRNALVMPRPLLLEILEELARRRADPAG